MNDTHRTAKVSKKLALLAVILVALLIVQACGGGSGNGNSNGNSGGSNSGNTSGSSGSSGSGGQSGGQGGSDGGSTPSQPAAIAPPVLSFGYVGGATALPLAAEGWGFHTGIIQEHLKQYGITEINITGFLTGPDLNESLISGRLDVGSSGDAPAINARAAGAKTRLITQTTYKGRSILIAPKDGAQSLEQLAGKKIAVVKGSSMHRYLLTILKESGVDAEVLNINSTGDSLAALKRGEVDAVATVPYLLVVYQILQDDYQIINDSVENPDLASTSSIVVTEDYLKKFPDFPKVWNEARELAVRDLKSQPDEYFAWLAELTGAPIEAVPVLYPIENVSDIGLTDEGIRLAEIAKNFLVSEGVAGGDFSVQDWLAR